MIILKKAAVDIKVSVNTKKIQNTWEKKRVRVNALFELNYFRPFKKPFDNITAKKNVQQIQRGGIDIDNRTVDNQGNYGKNAMKIGIRNVGISDGGLKNSPPC